MLDLHENVVTMINSKSCKVNQVSLIRHWLCDAGLLLMWSTNRVLLVTRHDGHKGMQSTDTSRFCIRCLGRWVRTSYLSSDIAMDPLCLIFLSQFSIITNCWSLELLSLPVSHNGISSYNLVNQTFSSGWRLYWLEIISTLPRRCLQSLINKCHTEEKVWFTRLH